MKPLLSILALSLVAAVLASCGERTCQDVQDDMMSTLENMTNNNIVQSREKMERLRKEFQDMQCSIGDLNL